MFLTGVAADSASDAWAVGLVMGQPQAQPVIMYWTGKAWRRVRPPAKVLNSIDPDVSFFTAIGAASARDVWVVTGSERYLRLNNGHWTTGLLPRGHFRLHLDGPGRPGLRS